MQRSWARYLGPLIEVLISVVPLESYELRFRLFFESGMFLQSTFKPCWPRAAQPPGLLPVPLSGVMEGGVFGSFLPDLDCGYNRR